MLEFAKKYWKDALIILVIIYVVYSLLPSTRRANSPTPNTDTTQVVANLSRLQQAAALLEQRRSELKEAEDLLTIELAIAQVEVKQAEVEVKTKKLKYETLKNKVVVTDTCRLDELLRKYTGSQNK